MKKSFLPAWLAFIVCSVLCRSVFAQSFSQSNLPIVVIEGSNFDGAYSYVTVSMGIIDNGPGNINHVTDPFNAYDGKIKIKLRGSSSKYFPKKCFRFTTINQDGTDRSVPLLGMPADEDWIFDAAYQDKTFLRDALSFKIFREMGHYSSRTRFVEMVVNGSYKGIYAVDEKIKRDEDRVDISKLKKEDIAGDQLTGGYIIKIDKVKWPDQGFSSHYNSDQSDSVETKCFYIYHYPDADSMPYEQKKYIKDYVREFEDVMAVGDYKDPVIGYRKYIDVPSFVDMFILTEFSGNIDGYRISSYFYKDRDSVGGKLKAGPAWDSDLAWGNHEAFSQWNWQYDSDFGFWVVPFWWRKLLNDQNFKSEMNCRWQELRAGVLSIDRLYAYIDSMALYLDDAQERNFDKWPILGVVVPPGVSPPAESYEEEIIQLKEWIADRIEFMDNYLPGSCVLNVSSANAEKNILVGAFPNPFSEELNITYDQLEAGNVTIELYSSVGKRVEQLFEAKQAAGLHSQSFSTSDLAAGIYFLRFSVNSRVYNVKVVKTG